MLYDVPDEDTSFGSGSQYLKLKKVEERLKTTAFYLQRYPVACTLKTTVDFLFRLKCLAQCPLDIEAVEEVNTGGSEQTLDGEGSGDGQADVQTSSESKDKEHPSIEEFGRCGGGEKQIVSVDVVQHQGTEAEFSDKAVHLKDGALPLPLNVTPLHFFAKALVLDMNGLLLRRYALNDDDEPPLHTGFRVVKVYKGGSNLGTVCFMRPDAEVFIQECAHMFYLCLWSSCYMTNINKAMNKAFPGLHPQIWRVILSQKECTKMPFKFGDIKQLKDNQLKDKGKPVFAKNVDTLVSLKPELKGVPILIVDDTRYKNMLNVRHGMVCPPTFEPTDQSQDRNYLTKTLLPWLKEWRMADDSKAFVERNMILNDRDSVSQLVIDHWMRVRK